MGTQIADAIYTLYGGKLEDDDTPVEVRKGRKRHLSASDGLASACPRFAWYEANSPVPRIVNPFLRRRFMYGSLHEDKMVQELSELSSLGWQIKGSQMNVTMWGVRGYIDLIVGEPTPILEEVMVSDIIAGRNSEGQYPQVPSGHYRKAGLKKVWKLLEIKTMNPEDFKNFKEVGLDAFPRYKEQAMFYLKALTLIPWARPEESILKGILLGENTFPLGELFAVEFDLDNELIAEMEEHYDTIDTLIKYPKPPERPFAQDSKKCKFCFRKLECWGAVPRAGHATLDQLEDPKEFTRLLTKFMQTKERETKEHEAGEEWKRQFRNFLEKEGVNSINAEVVPGLRFTAEVKDIHKNAYTVKEHDEVRFEVKSR